MLEPPCDWLIVTSSPEVFFQWAANYAIAQAFPIMLTSIGLAASYSFYGVCAVISFFLVWRFINETKGKELEAMEG